MKHPVIKRLLQITVQTAVILAVLFLSAGRINWLWPWVYLVVATALVGVAALILPPELIAERAQPKEGVKPWDKRLTSLLLPLSIALFVTIGLDERFGWSPDLAPWLHMLGFALMSIMQLFFTWAMASNKFFSTLVRIQTDRGHTVQTGGPYRYIRHPGYLTLSLTWMAISVALGSLWGLIPAALIGAIYVVRTALEDHTLQEELPGYKEYAQQVRYRLLPGIW
jgi:protein-S-isoprenylcysteine O-methyltransferase Ste14